MSNLTYLTEALKNLNEADITADKSDAAEESKGENSYTELISDAGCSLYKINNYDGIKVLGKYSKWDISGWADGDFSEAKRIYNDKIRKFLLRGGKGGFYVITTKNPRVKYLFAVNNIGQIVSIFDVNGNNISLSDIKAKLSTVAIYNYIIKEFKIRNNQSSEVKSKEESLLKEDEWSGNQYTGNLTNAAYDRSIPAHQTRDLIRRGELADYMRSGHSGTASGDSVEFYRVDFTSAGKDYMFAAEVENNTQVISQLKDFLKNVIKDVSDVNLIHFMNKSRSDIKAFDFVITFTRKECIIEDKNFERLIDKKALNNYKKNMNQKIEYLYK